MLARAVLDELAFAFDAYRLASCVEVGVAVPSVTGEVDGGAAAALDAAMALVDGFVPGRVASVDGPEIVEDGLLIVLNGADHIVGVALEQAARGVVLGVHRIDGDGTPGEVEAVRELAARRGSRCSCCRPRPVPGSGPSHVRPPRPSSGAPFRSASRRRAHPCRPWRPGRGRCRAGRSTGRWRCPASRAEGRRGCCGRW